MTSEVPLTLFQPVNNSSLSSRIFFIDLLKAVSISAVVFYHAVFFPISTYFPVAIPELILSSAFRFCVPVLLTISFFLFERELNKSHGHTEWSICKKRLIRIIIPTIFWFGLSGFIQIIRGNSLSELFGEMLTGNIYIGAYFLLILIQLTPVYILVRRWLKHTRNILFVIGLQSIIFIGIKVLTFHVDVFEKTALAVLANIDRPFFIYWFVYMAIGCFLYRHLALVVKLSTSISVKLKVLLVLITSILMMWEYSSLIPKIGSHFYVFEYALLTCTISVFVSFISMASVQEDDLPKWLSNLIHLLSKYSLGIFCVNGILSQGFSLLGRQLFDGVNFNLLELFTARVVGFLILITVSLAISICLKKVGLKACVT